MWNKATKQLVADEKLVVIGVIQEQHAERCRLYKQWQQYEFPIVQDAFTELGVAVVPIPILIDEHGIVMATRLSRPSTITKLVEQKTEAPKTKAPKLASNYREEQFEKHLKLTTQKTTQEYGWEEACALGDAFMNKVLTGEDKEKQTNIRLATMFYNLSLAEIPDPKLNGYIYFRLGVANRMKFDQSQPDELDHNDFTMAAGYWSKALEVNPNQYIWRRRIQQYGPRLSKPYPFYDWVEQAQKEIKARGETPIELTVALTGSEIAQRSRKFTASPKLTNPDPESKITLDPKFVKVHPTAVPQSITAGQAVRVHLSFDLNKAKWNNESDDMVVWIESSELGSVSNSLVTFPNPKEAESGETRTVEFEFKTNASASSSVTLTGYALYYVCDSETGQCLYRRQNFSVPINVNAKSK